MADWNKEKLKTEYITTKTSYRKLGEKYGVHYRQIAKIGKAENWEELRTQHEHRTLTKILECDTKKKVNSAQKLNDAANLLLDIAVTQMKGRDPMEIDTQEMRHISGVLRDVKEILMVKSDADLREQEARIKKLQKETEDNEDTGREIVVRIEGSDLNGYSS